MRSPNGYGTVYRLSGKRRKPWVARVTQKCDAYLDDDGEIQYQLKRQVIGHYATKTEALQALAMNQVNPVSPRAGITLAELYDEWSDIKFSKISTSTQNNYRAARHHIDMVAGSKVKEIRTAHLQKLLDRCHSDGLSRSSLEKIRALLVMLYDYAVQNDILSKNYAKFITLPKLERIQKERFSDIEIKKLFAQAADPWVQTVLILILTGMRISEMLQLTKFNLDLENGLITGGVKTDAGKNRIIPIHPSIAKFVSSWAAENGSTIICSSEGKKLAVKAYRNKYYYPALELANVRRLSPHACRHTFGSIMADYGAATLSIQKIMGHANYSTTADIYTHPEIDSLKKAINQIKIPT